MKAKIEINGTDILPRINSWGSAFYLPLLPHLSPSESVFAEPLLSSFGVAFVPALRLWGYQCDPCIHHFLHAIEIRSYPSLSNEGWERSQLRQSVDSCKSIRGKPQTFCKEDNIAKRLKEFAFIPRMNSWAFPLTFRKMR